MRNVPRNSAECFHWWAHQARESARSGNVSFQGPILFSYAEPIAVLLGDDRVLISNRGFSITTSGHQSSARQATSHMARISAPFLPCYGNTIPHRDNRDHWVNVAESAVAELKNHPRRKKSVSDKIASAVSSYNAYRKFFALDWPELNSDEMRLLVEERATQRAEKEAARLAREAERMKEAQKLQEADLLLWRENLPTDRFRTFTKTALRLTTDGKEIETTRGARVPVEVAPLLWRLACRHREYVPDHPMKIGSYRLDRIEASGTLHIGCHTIPWDELVLMAHKLNYEEYSDAIEHNLPRNSESQSAEARV